MSNPDTATTSAPDLTANLTPGQKLAGVYVLRRQASAPDSETRIWLAHDEVLGKDVSLHFIPAVVRGDSRAMNELRQEIKRNRQLIHPNILRVYDLIEEAEWAAISMDSFEGESVASLLKQRENGFFEPSDIKPWLQQACSALEDVHKINLVHRNISPSNLFVDKSGKLLIANFGIGRVMDDAIGRAPKQGDGVEKHLAYMSPQQLDGEPPARTDDVYSLGVTIYELLVGEPPFVGGEMVSQIRKGVPQPMMERRAKLGKRGGTILPPWEKAVAACLAKSAADRPQSDMDVAGKLGVSGKLSPAAETSTPPANVVTMKPSRPEPPKSTVILARPSGKKEAAGSAQKEHAPARTFAEIAAAVEADEREAALESVDGDKHGNTTRDIYPSLYPKKSKGPMIAVAAVLVVAALAGYAWYTGQSADEQARDSTAPVVAKATDSDLREASTTSARETRKEEATPAPRVPATPLKSANSEAAIPPASSKSPEIPPQAPLPVAEAPSIGLDGPLLAEAKPKAKPPQAGTHSATPAPAHTPSSNSANGGTSAAVVGTAAPVDPNLPTDKLRQMAEAADKKLQDARKQQQEAETAAADLQKSLEEKTKAAAPVMAAAKELQAQRQQKEDQAAADSQSAQQARQAAEEKARQAEESKKALADWVSRNQSKLAARDAADSEIQALQKSQAEKRTSAAEAAKAAADAEATSKQVALVLQKAQDTEKARLAEEARKAAEEKAAKRAQLDKELQKVDDMRKELESKMKALEDLRKQIDQPSNTSPPPAPAAPAGSQTPPGRGGAVAIASSPPATASIPPAPPQPTPIMPSSGTPRNEANKSPTAPPIELAMKTEPAPVSPPQTELAPESKPADAHGAFENSLGMKFVPVGDVFFCIWPTRVKDFDVFAKETNLKSTIWRSPGFKQGPDHPVVDVTWNEAVAFAKWLTDRDKKKGILMGTQIYRLPTDLEWSKAVGLPDESGKTPEVRDMGVPDVFPWGTQWPPPPNVGNYTGEETGSDVAIKGYDDGFAWTSPVGSFPPNKYGLYDMGGNVWQWCMDSWNPESKAKVLRGASWYNGGLKLSLLSSCRVNELPDSSTDNYGFRIVRAVDTGKTKGK